MQNVLISLFSSHYIMYHSRIFWKIKSTFYGVPNFQRFCLKVTYFCGFNLKTEVSVWHVLFSFFIFLFSKSFSTRSRLGGHCPRLVCLVSYSSWYTCNARSCRQTLFWFSFQFLLQYSMYRTSELYRINNYEKKQKPLS